ncbi:MAG TPA: undecaprenyl-phosphate glucose phosphotransferase [Aggregatilineales bacterium]|nr:undecaprenyl-phosphate glucose phosphotransferase [Aggregatilineales bacterium]
MIIDAVMLVAAFFVGYLMRSYAPILTQPFDPPGFFDVYVPITTVHTLSVLLVFYFARLYHHKRAISRIDLFWSIVQSVSIGTVTAIAIETLAFKNSGLQFDYPRGVLLYAWFFSILLITVGRGLHRQVVYRLQQANVGRDNIIVVGNSEVSRSIIKTIRLNPNLGYNLIGAVTETGEGRVAKASVIGKIEELPRLIDAFHIDQVILAIPEATRRELVYLVTLCQRGQVDIKIYPDNFAFIAGTLTVDDLSGVPLLSVRDVALRGWKLSLKRAVDFLGAAFGLVILSPVMMGLAVAIWLKDGGPVFFSQERVGLDGKPFPMIKFRTMIPHAEDEGKWTTENDSRITAVGKFMRPRNLDELPQFINVLFGQMSLVGPRPEQIEFVEKFRRQFPRYSERHREKSGMTGWAQVNGYRGDTSIEERLRADLYYVENWSLWLDFKIIIRTVWQTIMGRNPNAY